MTPARGTVYLVAGREVTDLAEALSEALTTDGATAEAVPDTSDVQNRLTGISGVSSSVTTATVTGLRYSRGYGQRVPIFR
nr:hypothetical protein [Haloarcula taiwanensis]